MCYLEMFLPGFDLFVFRLYSDKIICSKLFIAVSNIKEFEIESYTSIIKINK